MQRAFSNKEDYCCVVGTFEEVEVFAVSDKKKYEPENKSRKAKPGKPGIYVE